MRDQDADPSGCVEVDASGSFGETWGSLRGWPRLACPAPQGMRRGRVGVVKPLGS